MKQPILNPAMSIRVVLNSMTKLWNRYLWFRVLTLPVVILGALLTAYALKKPNYNHVT